MAKKWFTRLAILSSLLIHAPLNLADGLFPQTIKVESNQLKLCSQAELKAYRMIHVGFAAVYLENCSDLNQMLNPAAKRIRFVYEREIPARAFKESSEEYLKINLGAKYGQWRHAYAKFNSSYKDVKKGDYYELSFQPQTGLSLYLNNQRLATLSDPEQALGYFNIWFGAEPFSEALKEALLTPLLSS